MSRIKERRDSLVCTLNLTRGALVIPHHVRHLLLLLLFVSTSLTPFTATRAQTLSPPPPTSSSDDSSDTQKIQSSNTILLQVALANLSDPQEGEIMSFSTAVFPLGASMAGVRLSLASLLQSGFTFYEFSLPPSLQISPASTDVFLLYRNFTSSPYRLPSGASLVTKVVGLQIFPYPLGDVTSYANVTSVAASTSSPIVVTFSNFTQNGTAFLSGAMCTAFDTSGNSVYDGSGSMVQNATLDTSPSIQCQATSLGDFALSFLASPPPPPLRPPPPSPISPPPSPISPPLSPPPLSSPLPPPFAPSPVPAVSSPPPSEKSGSNAAAIAGGVVGGVLVTLLLLLLAALFLASRLRAARIAKMEREAENSVALETAMVGGGRAPAASAERTRAVLEGEEV